MDNWETHKKAYQDLGRPQDQIHDDLLGRRILKGLGIERASKGNAIYTVEHHLMGTVYADQPLWPRAQRVFMYCLSRNPQWHYLTGRWRIEALHVKDVTDVVDALELATDYTDDDVPLLFVRFLGTNNSCTVTLWHPAELEALTPPFSVLACQMASQWRAVKQETAAFVEQFGPYDIMIDRGPAV